MLESTEQAGAKGTETPTEGEAQAAAQAQAGASEQGGGTQDKGGEQQTERPGYMDSMPDTHKNNETLYQFKSQGELADAALKSLEKQELKPPGADAPQEERDNWNALLGVPGKPEEYGFSKPENLPEGMGYNEEKAAAFAKDCHEAGIPKNHAKFLFDRYNAEMAAMHTAQDETLKNAIASNKEKLEEEYKSDFGTVQKKADEIVFRAGGSDFLEGLDSEGLRSDVLTSPTMIKFFLRHEKAFISDSAMPGQGKPGVGDDGVERDPHTGEAKFKYPSLEGQESTP